MSRAAKYRAEQVGMIFQGYNLMPQLTALENVLLPMIALGRTSQSRARELLGAVGLAVQSCWPRKWFRPDNLDLFWPPFSKL
jgi:predicted ABC-type transport system involved in lysophospholipase L1 biosynthesis ATPase subunit